MGTVDFFHNSAQYNQTFLMGWTTNIQHHYPHSQKTKYIFLRPKYTPNPGSRFVVTNCETRIFFTIWRLLCNNTLGNFASISKCWETYERLHLYVAHVWGVLKETVPINCQFTCGSGKTNIHNEIYWRQWDEINLISQAEQTSSILRLSMTIHDVQ